MANNEKKINLQFAAKMMWGEHTYTPEGKDKEITCININFPKTSKYVDHYITVNSDKVAQSKFNDKMKFISYDSDIQLTVKKYDKEKGTTEKQKVNVSEIKKEFDSWKKAEKESINKEQLNSIPTNESIITALDEFLKNNSSSTVLQNMDKEHRVALIKTMGGNECLRSCSDSVFDLYVRCTQKERMARYVSHSKDENTTSLSDLVGGETPNEDKDEPDICDD